MGISEWVYKTFNKKIPKYRIYGHKWKIILLENGSFEVSDNENIITQYTSDDDGKLLAYALRLRASHMKPKDGYMYDFYVTKNKDPNEKWILII